MKSILIGLFVFVIAQLFLKSPIENLSKKIRFWYYKLVNGFSNNNIIDNYFHTISQYNPIELVAYQFGLRPNLPIIDILYLELLKKNQKKGTINKIVIFPTIDKSATTQTEQDLLLFKENISKVFCNDKDCFEIINPFRKSELTSKELIEENFIDTLSYLGSKKFYNTVFEISKQNINGIQDFNKFHSKEKSIMTLITHVFKAWEVREYILNYIQNSNQEKMNIGFIFWEVEYDKWGIYNRTAKDSRIDELTLFIGKSILSKRKILLRKRKKPIAVFTRDAIGLFDEKEDLLDKIVKHDKKQVNLLIEIISTILQDNYSFELSKNDLIQKSIANINSLISSEKVFGSIYSELKSKIKTNHKVLFTLLLKLRSEYGC